MTDYPDQRLAELIAALQPPPEDCVRRAQRIPAEHPVVRDVLQRAETDAAFRTALVEDVEAALERAGFARDRDTIDAIRWGLRLEDDPHA